VHETVYEGRVTVYENLLEKMKCCPIYGMNINMEVEGMINNIKPGYVNPLKMMKKDSHKNALDLVGGMKKAEKRQKELEAEKQSLQNSLLLMKGTSGDAGTSEESIEVLEKKLEEITKEIQSGRKPAAGEWHKEDVQTEESQMSVMRRNFDWCTLSDEVRQPAGHELRDALGDNKSEPQESSGYYGFRKDEFS
jgi:hypothetical protein